MTDRQILALDDMRIAAPESPVVVRLMGPSDLPRLQELSPPTVKNPAEFFVHATLVAEIDGDIVGYTQSSLGPDGILYSLAIRIDAAYKGRGIGKKLMETKVELARAAGATSHYYAIAHDGEEAIKRICRGLGMHLCQQRGAIDVYAMTLAPMELA